MGSCDQDRVTCESGQDTSERIREGGGRTHVTRAGEIVYREWRPWTASVRGLLRHLRDEGFEEAPPLAGTGSDERGRETLFYVEGKFVHPAPWSDDALSSVGALVRRLHDATATFRRPVESVWQPWFLREL